MNSAQPVWITVAEAAVLLKLKPATVIRRIQRGMLPSRTPPDIPFTNDGKENYEVRLDALPIRLQYNYLYSHLPPEEQCSLDLVTPRSALGNACLRNILTFLRSFGRPLKLSGPSTELGKSLQK